MTTRNITLVVVPGTGARSLAVDTNMTVADFVCQQNLHGRDIIVNGVGVPPTQWNVTTLNDAVEVFATGSVKGNQDRQVTLVVVPGTGARNITVNDSMTLADLVCRENLHGRDLIINGNGISASQWNTTTLQGAVEIFATGSVKGNIQQNAVLVVVPGTGAKSVTFDSDITVAQFVCEHNLHGRDIILDGVGCLPSTWSETTLGSTREIFATGSVKGNATRQATLVVVPGTGAKQVQIEDTDTVANFVCTHNLHGRDIIINGVGISPTQWSVQTLSDAVEIFATGSVKGNGAQSFLLSIFDIEDAEKAYSKLVESAIHEYGHNRSNGTISTVDGFTPAMLGKKVFTELDAFEYAQERLNNMQKYECEALEFKNSKGQNGFLFYGWAAC